MIAGTIGSLVRDLLFLVRSFWKSSKKTKQLLCMNGLCLSKMVPKGLNLTGSVKHKTGSFFIPDFNSRAFLFEGVTVPD